MIKKVVIKLLLIVGAIYCAGTAVHLSNYSEDSNKAVEKFLSGKSTALGGVDML